MIFVRDCTDIENYVSNMNPAGVVAMGGDAQGRAAEAIRSAPDHPPWETDWEAWLDEHAERLAIEATA